MGKVWSLDSLGKDHFSTRKVPVFAAFHHGNSPLGLNAYSATQLGHAARKSLARGDVVEAPKTGR